MKTLRISIMVSLFLLLSLTASAASINQIKGRRALLDLTGLAGVKVGDQLFALDAQGKRKALLRVKQVRGNRAIADIEKGRGEVGQDLQTRGGSSAREVSRPVREGDLSSPPASASERLQRMQQKAKNGPAWGLLGNFHQTSMDVQFSVGQGIARRTASASMSGSSFGVSGFYDYVVSPRFQVRAISGLDQISTAGSTANEDCGQQTTRDCNFSVTYLTLAGQARYFLNDANTRYWIGGGGAFLLAMSKASNILNTSQISTNQIYFLSGGVDIGLSRNTFVPISFDYGMFPSSDTVKANLMTLRAGYGWFF